MIGALWTGISGLSSQQKALDNESNNIANVNTIGYKSSRISFADQVYQDRIGKGSKILDAEKLYTQGTIKPTGVSYDMALAGDGFFTVANTSPSGITENFYTRAGNFRMGDNGTLQDSAGNEVQGWMMVNIDPDSDVLSTNPNVSTFTNDYNLPLSSKIIKYSTYVETITAKATDYKSTARSDSPTIFSGAGAKTAGAKVADIEAANADYASWLQKLKDNPNGGSATSTAQASQINFKTGTESLISKDGDQISVLINGQKISQNYVSVTAEASNYAALEAANATLTNPFTLTATASTAPTADDIIVFNRIASQIETYKGLADKISEVTGLSGYMASETGTTEDVLELSDTFALSTDYASMLKGIIEIKSLIPGQEFTVTEVVEESAGKIIQGNTITGTPSRAGMGVGALESSRDALAQLVSGKQQDVYTPADIGLPNQFTYGITIYDKETKQTIEVPSAGNPVTLTPIDIRGAALATVPVTYADITTVDEFVTAFNTQAANSSPKLSDYVEAKNINGNLVIQTTNDNFDVEFSGDFKKDAGTPTPIPLDTNANYSGREGAGAEFLEIVNRVDQTASQGSLQLKLDTLGLTDSAFGEFSIDSTGLITMKQDGISYAIGQASIALFNSNRGLEPAGNNLLSKTTTSGEPIYNLNNDKTAEVQSKSLELSTADLSESLVNLMVFQRAFEANAKSITTADTLLNTLINLKR
ncbi:flagellar hook-basal body complex protein [Poseidonibacter sp.]|uniref:flagellar hook-basal body complex protein n=1 Tax=Poseidonibacter sp. TaxID=2321188 RepID=UPI003C748571